MTPLPQSTFELTGFAMREAGPDKAAAWEIQDP